jgi:hypothetical protein
LLNRVSWNGKSRVDLPLSRQLFLRLCGLFSGGHEGFRLLLNRREESLRVVGEVTGDRLLQQLRVGLQIVVYFIALCIYGLQAQYQGDGCDLPLYIPTSFCPAQGKAAFESIGRYPGPLCFSIVNPITVDRAQYAP